MAVKRVSVLMLLATFAAAGGCAAPAKYIEKRADGGVVAVPDDTDCWPSYNRRAALEKIQQHVGADYVITDERRVVVGQTTMGNGQSTTTNHTLNPKNPAYPAQQTQTTTGSSTAMTQDVTQWQITYQRKPASTADGSVRPAGGTNPRVGDVSATGAASGLTPAVPGGPDPVTPSVLPVSGNR